MCRTWFSKNRGKGEVGMWMGGSQASGKRHEELSEFLNHYGGISYEQCCKFKVWLSLRMVK